VLWLTVANSSLATGSGAITGAAVATVIGVATATAAPLVPFTIGGAVVGLIGSLFVPRRWLDKGDATKKLTHGSE
jgi:hypothetical protein